MNEANLGSPMPVMVIRTFQSTPHSMNEANPVICSQILRLLRFQSTPHSMNEANDENICGART